MFWLAYMKKKLLILGMSGLTGYKIAKNAIQNYEVFGTFNARSLKLENCAFFVRIGACFCAFFFIYLNSLRS